MKGVLLVVCGLFALNLQAQVFVAKKNINVLKIQYIEVWDKFQGTEGVYYAMVDYGQKDDPTDLEGHQLRITSKKGSTSRFNSIVEILNFLDENGWELIQIREIGKYESSYLMRKKKSDMNGLVDSSIEN